MTDRPRHTLDTVPEPQPGQSVRFWHDDVQWTIDPHHDIWIVHRRRPHGATAVATLRRRGVGWSAEPESAPGREWEGTTIAEVLRHIV